MKRMNYLKIEDFDELTATLVSTFYTSFTTGRTRFSSRPAAQWRGGNKLRIRGRFASGRANCRRPATATVLEHPFYRLRLAPLLPPPFLIPRCTSLLPGGLTCFHARDSGESNSRAYARTPGRQHRACTTGVRKSLKGLVPTLVVYAASRGTVPCTCWSSRRTGAVEISEIPSSRHVPADQTHSTSRNADKIGDRMLILDHTDNVCGGVYSWVLYATDFVL